MEISNSCYWPIVIEFNSYASFHAPQVLYVPFVKWCFYRSTFRKRKCESVWNTQSNSVNGSYRMVCDSCCWRQRCCSFVISIQYSCKNKNSIDVHEHASMLAISNRGYLQFNENNHKSINVWKYVHLFPLLIIRFVLKFIMTN